MIKVAHENFVRIKKGFLNSFETIDLLGDFITKQDGAILKNFLKTDFKTNENDAIINLLVDKRNNKIILTDLADYYSKGSISVITNEDPPNLTARFQLPSKSISGYDIVNPQTVSIETQNLVKGYDFIDSINSENINIINNAARSQLSISTFDFILDKDKKIFEKIFFDDNRFIKNLAENNAKKVKNYYYVYDNLLNNS